jgi:hypothetical protein
MPNILNIDYRYDEAPTLEDFSNSNARVRGLMGPFGSGKSSACVAEIPQRAQQMPIAPDGFRHSRYAVIRNTYMELKSTTLKTLHQWLPPQYFGKYTESKHSYLVKALPQSECEIIDIALDRPEDIGKLLSLELTGAWVNEAREVPWSIINALQGRIGRYPPVSLAGPYWHGIWMDTNPPDSDSEWYKFFEEETWKKSLNKLRDSGAIDRSFRNEDFAQIFKQPSGLSRDAENLKYLKAGYYAELAIGKSAEWIKVYVHGQYGFVSEGKLVYPEYIDRVHCQAVDPMPGINIIRSWDFGLTPACIFSQMLPDGRWLTFDEMVSEDMSIDQFSDEVLDHCSRSFRGNATFEDWGDPAGEQRAQTDKRTCFEIMRNKGIMIEASIQEPKLRQESVRKALRTPGADFEPRFVLHPRCKVLRKGFMGGYRRRRMQTPGTPRYTEQPDKNAYSHPHDALQYGIVQYFASLLTERPRDDDDFAPREDYAALGDRSQFTGY